MTRAAAPARGAVSGEAAAAAPDARRLLPLSAGLGRRERRALTLVNVLLAAMVGLASVNAVFGVSPFSERWLHEGLTPAVYILVAAIVFWRAARIREARATWMIFALGIGLYGLGNVIWDVWMEQLKNPPIPSICDALWLSLYPAFYVGIVRLVRVRHRRVPVALWLDAVVAGLSLAAVAAALMVGPLSASVSGGGAAVVTELAYPLGDLLLAALIVGVLALRGWQLSRMWSLLAVGFVGLAAADSMYALQVAGGASSTPSLTNAAYLVSVMLLALAAWQPAPRARRRLVPGAAVLTMPAMFTGAALAVLVYDHFSRLDPVALWLALLTILLAAARTVLVFRDVGGLAEARQLALTDDLTSLSNRRAFLQRVDDAVLGATASSRRLVIMHLNLNEFKELNDTLGGDAGNIVLRQVGERLGAVVHAPDTVARLGGAEFAMLLFRRGGFDAEHAAAAMLESIDTPFQVGDVALRMSACIGVAVFPEDARTATEVLAHADLAVRHAQASHTAVVRYTHSLTPLELAGELSRALSGDEIVVHFQPQADARTRRVVGVEALVRWRHPTRGLIAPAEFVGIAEQAGLGRALTERVLDLALAQISEWRARGLDMHVGVNTTVADLQDLEFPPRVLAALAKHHLPPEALVLEVTETSVFADSVRVRDVLARLREHGISLSLDDFGTGYSSLTHLKLLPVCEVKIDRSFVARMARDPVDAAIVQSAIDLANRIGIRVVAEGVEDDETWNKLLACGCGFIQGFGLSPPLPGEQLEGLLPRPTGRRWRSPPASLPGHARPASARELPASA